MQPNGASTKLVIRKSDERNPLFWITTGLSGVWHVKELELDHMDDTTWPSFLRLLPHLFNLEVLRIDQARLTVINHISPSFVPLLRVYEGPLKLLDVLMADRRLEEVTINDHHTAMTEKRFFDGLVPLFRQNGVTANFRAFRVINRLSLPSAYTILWALNGYTVLEGLFLGVDDEASGDSEKGDSDNNDDAEGDEGAEEGEDPEEDGTMDVRSRTYLVGRPSRCLPNIQILITPCP
jgi:hypothetical protein